MRLGLFEPEEIRNKSLRLETVYTQTPISQTATILPSVPKYPT
jgi:hypothetical protein